MSKSSVTTVALATTITLELSDLWDHALHDVRAKRGGVALLATLCGVLEEHELLEALAASGSLWTLYDDDHLKALGVVRAGVVEALYVAHEYRRQRVATTFVRTLLSGPTPPYDAYALPGDRGMKSLYESLGWKARLLTMRGA